MKLLSLFLVFLVAFTARAETPDHQMPILAGEAFATPVTPATRDLNLFRGSKVDQDAAEPFDSYIAPNEHHNYLMEACLPKEGGALISVGTFRALNVFSSGKASHLVMLDIASPTVAFNKVNLQLIAAAEDRWRYLSLLFTGEGKPFLEKRARRGEVSYREFLRELKASGHDGIVAKWEKNVGVSLTEAMRAHLILQTERNYLQSNLDEAFRNYEAYEVLDKAFIGNDERFNTLKRLIGEDKVTVVTGNIAGEKTMSSLNQLLREKDMKVAAVDVSNVPGYLDDETTKKALANIRALPMREDGRIFYTAGPPHFARRPHNWAYYSVPPSYTFRSHEGDGGDKFETLPEDPADNDIAFQPKEAPCGKVNP